MPYIPEERRAEVRPGSDDIAKTSGELNFQITSLATAFLAHHGTSYSTINDIIGALEGAKLEFYRRIVEPYENQKIVANGDVF